MSVKIPKYLVLLEYGPGESSYNIYYTRDALAEGIESNVAAGEVDYVFEIAGILSPSDIIAERKNRLEVRKQMALAKLNDEDKEVLGL